jgi:hypothetical protein
MGCLVSTSSEIAGSPRKFEDGVVGVVNVVELAGEISTCEAGGMYGTYPQLGQV